MIETKPTTKKQQGITDENKIIVLENNYNKSMTVFVSPNKD
jgi:hypothetical protein